MDTEFIKEYYQLKYPDTFMMYAVENNEKCKELYQELMCLEGKAEDAMRSMGKEYLQLHSDLFTVKGKMDTLIMRLAYLKGAQDREKMLRY